jgi:hypothetical protein
MTRVGVPSFSLAMLIHNIEQLLNGFLCDTTSCNSRFVSVEIFHQILQKLGHHQLVAWENLNGKQQETVDPQSVLLYLSEKVIVLLAKDLRLFPVEHVHDVNVKLISVDITCESIGNPLGIEVTMNQIRKEGRLVELINGLDV